MAHINLYMKYKAYTVFSLFLFLFYFFNLNSALASNQYTEAEIVQLTSIDTDSLAVAWLPVPGSDENTRYQVHLNDK